MSEAHNPVKPCRLFVITVTNDDLPPHERDPFCPYAVLLADGILPGLYLQRYQTAEVADEGCRFFANHYGVRARPLNGPWAKRAKFQLIKGGATPT